MTYTTMTPAEAVERLQENGHDRATAQQLIDTYLERATEKHGVPLGGWEVDDYDLADIEREHSRPETDAEMVQRLSDLGDQRTEAQTRLMDRLQELQEASDRTDQQDREWREEEDRYAEIDAQLDAAMERSEQVLADVDELLAAPVTDDLAAAAHEAHAEATAAAGAMSADAYYYSAGDSTYYDAARGAADAAEVSVR